MLNGRHFVLLGILACAGLFSVRDGQKQIDLCYDIGAIEKKLRDVRSEIALCKIKHQALQSPKAVMARVAELKLKVADVTTAVVSQDLLSDKGKTGTETKNGNRSQGMAQPKRSAPLYPQLLKEVSERD